MKIEEGKNEAREWGRENLGWKGKEREGRAERGRQKQVGRHREREIQHYMREIMRNEREIYI